MKRVVEIPENFSNFFVLHRRTVISLLLEEERFYYLPKVIRNIKLITPVKLEQIEGKTAVVLISKDKIDKRNARTDKPLPHIIRCAKHIWRMYIYPFEKRRDGTQARSDYTIKVCFDAFDIPDDDPLLSQYTILRLCPFGWIAIGKKEIDIPQRRIFKAVRELKNLNDPIRLMKIERLLNINKIEL